MQYLQQLEEAFPVRFVASTPLRACAVTDALEAVLRDGRYAGYDHIPVRDGEHVVGVLERRLAPAGGCARDAMAPLHESMIASASEPLLPVIEELDRPPEFRLVIDARHINGILTLSDLQKLPVRSLLFAKITHLEMLLAEWIRREVEGDDSAWLGKLSAARRGRVEAQWADLHAKGQDVDLLTAAEFCDKREAAVKLGALEPRSHKKATKALEDIEDLRNKLAHAGEFADTRENAHRTIGTVRTLRELIQELGAKVQV